MDPSPPAKLLELPAFLSLFPQSPNLGNFTLTQRAEVPPPFGDLLVHDHHMTITLEAYVNDLVDVDVLAVRNAHDSYARKILLRRSTDQKVVQFGIVRLNKSLFSNPVWQEIEAQACPLGRILINHNVMRKIRLHGLYQVKGDGEIAKWFELEPDTAVYGRTAMIYCDGTPAIELLEIVRGDK